MPESPLHVAVIVGSARDGRLGSIVARWFVEQCGLLRAARTSHPYAA
jgi:hypothetical protein